jgi:integrase
LTAALDHQPEAETKLAPTFAAAAARYLSSRQTIGLKSGTICDYETHLRVHLLPAFGDRPLEEIRPDEIEAFIATQRERGQATNSVIRQVGLLGAIYNYEIRKGRCERNPIRMIDMPRPVRQAEIKFLSVAELERLIDAVPRTRLLGPLERVFYLTAAMTGLRRGELLALRWMDLDAQAGVIRVRRSYRRGEFGTPKSRRSSRAVPLAERVRAELEQHRHRSAFTEPHDLIFAHPLSGHVLDPSRILKDFQTDRAAAGLRPLTLHSLRHTFGTRMAAAGAPIRALQEWLGHSDIQTTMIYTDYAPDSSQGAVWAARAFKATDAQTQTETNR